MSQTYQVRRGTAAEWTSANPTLPSGVIGLETDTTKWKIGNGSTAWASLNYVGGSAYTPGLKTAVTPNVLSVDTATVTIALPSGYKGFRIEAKVRSSVGGTGTNLEVRLNGDTTSSYQWQYVRGESTVASAAEQATAGTSMRAGLIPASGAPASYYGHIVVDIPFPDMTTGWKDVLLRGGAFYGTAAGDVVLQHTWGIRRNTAVITSISFFAGGNIIAGSSFKVMGFK